MLELLLPNEKFLESVKKGIAEYKHNPSPFDIYCIEKLILAENNDFVGYFEELEKTRNGENIPTGFVSSSSLWLIKDGKYIGSFDIRHKLNDYLQKRGGHIAYQIIPSERQKGYVKAGLKLALEYARTELKMDKALLTCEVENKASYKAMTSVMAEWGGEEVEPAEIDGKQEYRVWINTIPCR